jgi:hypothetical protein
LSQDNVQWQTFVKRVLAWVSRTQVYLDVVDDYELLTQSVQFDRWGREAFTGLFFFFISRFAAMCRLHSANNFDLSKYVLILENNMSEPIKEEINPNSF